MKKKQQNKNMYASVAEAVIPAGLALVAVGCLANFYGAFVNRGFIHEPLELAYYLRYVILLGGGFAAGYFLTRQSARTVSARLFCGIVYAALTMAAYWLLEIIRVSAQELLGAPVYPWAKAVFLGVPLLATLIAIAAAYFSTRRQQRPGLHNFIKVAVSASFLISEVYMLASGIYHLAATPGILDPNMSVWAIVGSYLTMPLIIVAVAYICLATVARQLDRLFLATLVGTLYSTFIFVLWELRTDPTASATNSFNNVVTLLAVIFAGTVLWRIRRAVK